MFRKGRIKTALTLGVIVATSLTSVAGDSNTETATERDARMKWWREARFGMFIHWNLSSVPAGVYQGKHNRFAGEWLMHDEKIPVVEYKQYAALFNPTAFNADEWVQLALDAGMKYMVITAKHHDGFAMYKSGISSWNICDATPFKRDPLKELAKACAERGMKLGFYYSHAQDWIHPGGRVPGDCWDDAQRGDMDKYLREIAVPQVREILTGYGPVAILWWDAPWEMNRQRADMFMPLLKLQPGILMNDRLGGEYAGDMDTPEQGIPETATTGRDWETCMTMNDTWGYKSFDNNWKSAETLIRNLVDIASKGGNFLLNVGPNAKGLIPAPSVIRLKAIGRWLKVNGESIYETRASPFPPFAWGRCTSRTDNSGVTFYLHVLDRPADGRLIIPGLTNSVESAWMLADQARHQLKTESGTSGTTVLVPAAAPGEICPVATIRITGSLKKSVP